MRRFGLATLAALAAALGFAVSWSQAAGGVVLSAQAKPARVASANLSAVRISYSLSAPALVEIVLAREVEGRRVHAVCLPPRPEFRTFPRCRLTLPLKRVVVRESRRGPHTRALTRALSVSTLAPGVYRVRVRALDQPRALELVLTVTPSPVGG